ncbi:MAG: RDD family protein [Steroidobacteraceae bacterium]
MERDRKQQQEAQLEYVGFWLRVLASLVDTVLLLIVTVPLLRLIYGRAFDPLGFDLTGSDLTASGPGGPANLLFDWVLPAVAVVAFWIGRQATPGKMLISAQIVDADTGAKPDFGQAVARYIGYFISTLPLCLGFVWVGLDPRKQGWHDKIARTVVVRPRRPGVEPVRFTASSSGAPPRRV